MSTPTRHAVSARTPIQLAAMTVGAVFLSVGILGFIPGVTTDFDSMRWAEHHSHAQLLGLFTVSVLHNVVHLAFGIAGLLAGVRAATARAYLIGGGGIYLVLWLYGLLIDQTSAANFVPLDTADNWLHFGLGIAMIALSAFPSTLTNTNRHLSGRQPGIIE
ncbi:DUF4383 domain-containing protein [Nocardia sp. CA-129566]|uniref:DUF4383 domain-containing protein n=1 Tax=Nocardia sp. CA-129566 TaxID=3239976 RepID=UPI003D960294